MPIDPVSILVFVWSTACAIQTWLAEREQKSETIAELNKQVKRVCEILEPLKGQPGLDRGTVSVLIDIAELLNRIKEHLSLWKEKSLRFSSVLAFLSPSAVTGMLKEDQQKLFHHISLLVLALQVSSIPPPYSPMKGNTEGVDIKELWRLKFGDAMYVPSSAFIAEIGPWINQSLDETLSNALLLAIDPQGIGIVTPANLEQFFGTKTIRHQVALLSTAIAERSGRSRSNIQTTDEPLPPTLLWIDDRMDNNRLEIGYAKELGICVVELSSTAVAKAWIEANEARLRQLESRKQLRIITDNARWEHDQRKGEFLNLSAGEAILRYLRGLEFASPVLVYCGRSIGSTNYVATFSQAGSTVRSGVCIAYIDGLVTGVVDDRRWQGFNV